MSKRLRKFYRALKPHRQRDVMITLLLMLSGAAAEMLTIAAVLPFLSLLAGPPIAVTDFQPGSLLAGTETVLGAAAALVAAGLMASGLRLSMLWMTQRTVNGIGHDLSTIIYGTLLRQPYAAHFSRNSNETLAGLEKVQVMVNGVLHPVMQGSIAAVLAAAIGAMLFIIDPLASVAMMVILALGYAALAMATRRTLQSHSQTLASSITHRTKLVRESFGGLRDILLDGSQPLFERRFARSDLEMRRGRIVSGFIASAPRLIVEAVAIVGVAVITVMLAWRGQGLAAALPVLGSLAIGAQRLLPLLQQVWFGFAQARSNAQLVDDVLALAGRRLPAAAAPRSTETLTGDIEVDAVSFSYGRSHQTLSDLSLHIHEGETVGITGPTGSGKSTLLDLLIGLLEPQSGSIRIGGQVLDPVNKVDWQSSLSHVPQVIYLADDTILANIVLGDTADTIDIGRAEEAARIAHADRFIAALPAGFSTKVGERGVRLSGGERQRLGIARAIYRQRPVLILDEATNALDVKTETAVMKGIIELGLTVIMVAHRDSSLRLCDRVFALNSGRVTECSAPRAQHA